MAQPTLQRNAATADLTFPSVAGSVILRRQLTGVDHFMFGIHIIQASAAFTIEVMGPLGVFAPYPQTEGTGIQGGGANGIVIVRGRWEQIKVVTTGSVAMRADLVLDAYAA